MLFSPSGQPLNRGGTKSMEDDYQHFNEENAIYTITAFVEDKERMGLPDEHWTQRRLDTSQTIYDNLGAHDDFGKR